MADINLDAQLASAAARRLTESGEELLTARQTTGATIESMDSARPWGRDELGDLFGRRYEEAANRTLETWRTTAERLGQLGSNVREATEASLQTDRVTSEVIDKVQ